MAVRSTCDIAHTSRSQDKPENVEIIEYQSEMRQKINGNIAGVQGVSRIRVQSVCSLITTQTTCAILCLRSWSLLGLVKDEDIMKVAVMKDVEGNVEEEFEDGWDSIKN